MRRLPRQLLSKRAEIAYELAGHLHRVDELESQLGHIDAALKLLDPAFKPPKQRPRKPPKSRRWLPHGDAARLSLAALRQAAKPLTTPDVVAHITKVKNLSFANRVDAEDFASSIAMALRRYAKKGAVENVGGPGTHRELSWQLTDTART
jgi:hypothetical protein